MPPPADRSGPQPDSTAVLIGMVRDMREEARQEGAATRETLNRVALELNSLHAARLPERIAEHDRRLRDIELAGERDRARFNAQSAIAGGLATAFLSGLVYIVSRSIHP